MQTNKSKKIMLIGGHLTPALATLSELQNRGYSNFIWVGKKHVQTASSAESPEYKLITAQNIPFISFKAGKIWRKWTLKTLGKALYNLLLIPAGFIHALFILIVHRPRIVVSFGGYIALPLVIAAKVLFIKSVTHEQTLTSGLANRLIAKFADRILISWEKTKSIFMQSKVAFTGNPIRREVLENTTNIINFNNSLPVIYVTGGNQGANTINWRLREFLPQLLEKANVIHQTGNSTLTNDYQKSLALKKSLPKELSERYLVWDNIFGNEIGEIFAKADLLVSRSGANTVTEILATGKLSVLIPIPWASQNEQLLNANLVADTGLGFVLEQYDEMQPQELFDAINLGLDALNNNQGFNKVPLNECKEKASKLIKMDASMLIVDELERLID
ncbi:UDP-N-acetylglucosamine--N-acetylmuramyl-(pentapeptide) pyrophosphoryl-undecaprenol N-acetylglucosamine transferase [Candidatus Dojkabacteria bacterium]|uniref:UDP-N-acetylglucosamine--N-acetylmuramyl-(pentapeptide) pyrophosphoryl-undecaprenol N-acetylglucosamine transferase n=1 Tax=Candidatus Dojkabacteria bacterium TaxID=2099670 RepID=A0A955L5H3_9BACT|nr:UDP-N-acetylglucosamine--N-acetylmuramyl-(pentapeptide) pyrophosphoryl-undecaprenol N-acetylglucosamine transferase [Candidatus Dojkabacteria bacterium]